MKRVKNILSNVLKNTYKVLVLPAPLFKGFKKSLFKQENEIVTTVSVLMLLAIVTKISGMLFLSFVAREFGASKDTDMFYLASVIPETITNIILLGAISGAIIPVFVKVLEKEGEKSFINSYSTTVNTAMLFFVLLAIISAVFAKELIPFAINLSGGEALSDPESIDQIVAMMRIMLIPQIILGLSAFLSTSLNIYQRFVIPQLAPLFFNIGKIIGILVIVPMLEGSIWGLVWGVLLGSILHLLIQLPLVHHLKLKFKLFVIDFKNKSFREAVRLGTPRIISLSVEQIAIVIDSIIAIGLVAGSLTAYQLGVRLVAIPLGLFGVTYSIASFPALSRLYAKDKIEDFKSLIVKLLNQLFFLAIPTTVLLLVLRIPIVRLVYGIFGGSFTWEDTQLVAWVVMFFALGLIFETMRSPLFRAYYAMHDSITPLISSVFIVVFGIITGVLLTNYLSHFDTFTIRELVWNVDYFFTRGDGLAGVGGLALSSSIVFTLEFIFLIIVLYKRKILYPIAPFVKSIFKKFLAGLVMLVVAYAMLKLWDQVLNTAKTIQLSILTVSTIASTFMVYLWTSYVLGVPEVEKFLDFFARKFKTIFRRNKLSGIK